MNFAGERRPTAAPGRTTTPQFHDVASALAHQLAQMPQPKLAALLGVSAALAKTNAERFTAFDPKLDLAKAPASAVLEYAALAYDGPAFRGLEAETLPKAAAAYLQDNLRILSGMYGAVRPYDLIQPYRLCMGTKLAVVDGGGCAAKNLYDLWAHHAIETAALTPVLNGGQADSQRFVVNVASQEYSKVVDRDRLPAGTLWVDCVFKDSGRVLSFFAKRARGLMARWCALHRVSTPEQLRRFDLEGYKYVAKESTETTYVFGRPKPPPASAAKAAKPKAKGAPAAKQSAAAAPGSAGGMVAPKKAGRPGAAPQRRSPKRRGTTATVADVHEENEAGGGGAETRAPKRRRSSRK